MIDDKQEPQNCDETSCKDDLMQGLMALFAQADAAATTEEEDEDQLDTVYHFSFVRGR